jgi:opacity protein-like surface antigen
MIPTDREDPTKEFPMKCFLIAALSATALSALAAAAPAAAQATAPGSPRGTAPVTIEGYGSSSAIVCDQAGTTCWHSVDRYDYPTGANVVVHPYDWQADNGATYAWREHPGRGYWQGNQWTPF